MIKKLRIKFIVLSMCSLFLVLTLIMGSINIVNYMRIVEEADAVLAVLAENGGKFPKKIDHKAEGFPRAMSPELPYESRYFSVLLNSTGDVISAGTGKIAAIDTQTAIEYAQKVWAEGKKQGFVEHYRFVQHPDGNENSIIFLDCGRSLDTFYSFFLSSCGISLLGLLAVFFLILLFSKRIIRPVSESYEKQKRFITDAGHEIKTPLTIIDADVDVLEMDFGENEWLQDIQKQTKRLTALTNDLVYLSRMEEDQNQFQMIDFPVSDVVAEAAQSFQALAKTQGKSFTSRVCPMLSMRGDEKAIRQLVSILLDNALKYSQEGGTISLTLEKQGRILRLSVFNTTATAMPRDSMEHLFDRFYRTDPSRNSQTGGYGIGLSIAKAIVSAHKGKITATTQDEWSLLITVTLPA